MHEWFFLAILKFEYFIKKKKKKSIDKPLYEKLFPILFKLIKYQLKLISLQDQGHIYSN